MKVRKLKSDKFLQNPFELAEYDDREVAIEMYETHQDSSLSELINEYADREQGEDDPDLEIRLEVLREIIAWKLKIPMFDYFIDCLNERFELIDRKIKKLDKYENHRHKTIMGLYTEKPVY